MNVEQKRSLTVLGLDTATEATTVAAVAGGEVLAEVDEPGKAGERPRHTAALLPAVERVVDACGGWSVIDRIAVGCGPGAFTGLRIGIAAARAMGESRGIEVVGVSTLEALALGRSGEPGPTLALIDARRGEVFGALFRPAGDGTANGRAGPVVCDPGDLARSLGLTGAGEPEAVAVGSGALRFRDELKRAGTAVAEARDPVHEVRARYIARLGEEVEVAGDFPPEPVYLRVPDAERWRKRDGKHISKS